MSLLDQQMAERRERILEAARSIIAERGYEGLTMRDLAHSSRVTVPTIYNLVGSKEQVLFAAVEQTTGSFVSSLARAPGDVIAVVDAAVSELLRMPRYYRALLLVLLTKEAAGPARRHADQALANQLGAALDELLVIGRDAQHHEVAQQLQQVFAETLGVDTRLARTATGREGRIGITGHAGLQDREQHAPVDQVQHLDHLLVVDLRAAVGDHLVEQDLRVAQRPVGLARDGERPRHLVHA